MKIIFYFLIFLIRHLLNISASSSIESSKFSFLLGEVESIEYLFFLKKIILKKIKKK